MFLYNLGIFGGYFYWEYVGGISGTCLVQANWYTMMPYGLLVGWCFAGRNGEAKRKVVNGC